MAKDPAVSRTAATSPSDTEVPRRRLNVRIDEREYWILIKLAGGQRSVGRWIERQVRKESAESKVPSVLEVAPQLRNARNALNRLLRIIDKGA